MLKSKLETLYLQSGLFVIAIIRSVWSSFPSAHCNFWMMGIYYVLCMITGVDFVHVRGRHPLRSDTEGGGICLASSIFWPQEIQNSGLRWNQRAVKIYLCWSSPEFGGKIQKFLPEIESVCDEHLFFGLHLNLGVKFRNEIELFSLILNQTLQNISPPRNLLNQQENDADVYNTYCIFVFHIFIFAYAHYQCA